MCPKPYNHHLWKLEPLLLVGFHVPKIATNGFSKDTVAVATEGRKYDNENEMRDAKKTEKAAETLDAVVLWAPL